MTDTSTLIPLNKLVSWNGNVRKTSGSDTGLAELAASIAAHGLINNLVVLPEKNGNHAVVAGGRRLAAHRLLVKQGKLPADHLVKCEVRADAANALEISLAENVVREDMHAADEFDAFRVLIDKGTAAADVGARFGVTETYVLQRMKLAWVSPVILAAYREDQTTLACVMAFAVTDDHKRQEKFWKSAQAWQRTDARAIRRALTENEITAADRRVRFVTLKAYEKAGGTVRRDLFSDGDDGVFIDKAELLQQLVADKLGKIVENLRAQGWKWVELLDSSEARDKCKRLESLDGPLPPKQQAAYDKLRAELKKLEAKKSLSDADEERASEIEDRIHELDSERPEVFTKEQMAIAGVFLGIDGDGRLDITCGYVKPEDVRAIKTAEKSGTDAKTKPVRKDGLSQSLEADLEAHRSAAVSALLIASPAVALAAFVHSLGMKLVYGNPFGKSLDCDTKSPMFPVDFRKSGLSRGIEAVEKARETWMKRLPSKQAEFWPWCLKADQKTLLSLLAFFAALAGNEADLLSGPLALDMEDWFTPTAANFFGRIGKLEIVKAIRDATGKPVAPATEKMKRSELALFAERAVKDTG